MAVWPPSLPDYVLVEGYDESPPENVIRTSMGVGPPKMRRRSTAAPRPIKCEQYLTKTQVATLDTFFTSTLSYGALQFDWTHPRTESSVSFRFVAPPVYNSMGGTSWHVKYNLEIMP